MSSDSNNPHEDHEAPANASADIENMIPIDEHVEEVHEDGMTVSRRGVYLLPNLFTTAALFSGFYAIISGMNGKFEAAAIAIFVAMVMDGLDGRVARLTNTQSKFGEQYDSLSDMVSFGVAPALVMFEWALVDLGKWGWAAAFCYTACAALRLARFNAQIGQVDKGVFVGLNSPSAAALIAGAVWAGHDTGVPVQLAVLLAFLTALVGLLMVSNFSYNSFKGVDLKGRVPFFKMLLVILLFAVISVNPPVTLLLLFTVYGFSGPASWAWGKLKSK